MAGIGLLNFQLAWKKVTILPFPARKKRISFASTKDGFLNSLLLVILSVYVVEFVVKFVCFIISAVIKLDRSVVLLSQCLF